MLPPGEREQKRVHYGAVRALESSESGEGGELASRLVAGRLRRQLSKRELARRIADHVEDQCPAVETLLSYVKRWESGKSGVSERYRFAYAAALGVDPADLFGSEDRDWDDMERRRLLQATLGLSAFAVTAPLTALTDLTRDTDPRDLADWHVAVADHLHALRTRPPVQARDDLALDLLRLRHQMAQPGADRTELQRILAALAVIYGGMLTRLGDHGPALRWWRAAAHAADDSGDLDLRLLVRAEAAGYGLYGQRDPATVLQLMDEIKRIAGHSRSMWATDLKGTRAKALALLGRHQEAKVAVKALQSAAPVGTPDCPIPALWLPDQVDFAESWVLSAAGDEQHAGEARERVLGYTWDYQYTANVSLHGALCTVVKGGTAEGVNHAAAILNAMPQRYRSQMITEMGKNVLAAVPIEDRALPAVRDFQEVLSATAPARALSN
jgi:transcriptional regulator with XRE-family HTH domain